MLVKHTWSLFIDNYFFLVNIKDCLFLEFDMPHIEQPLKLIIFVYKFVFKNKEYPQTRTQKFNINQEKLKMHSSATPYPSGGGGGLLQPPPPSFWYDPLDKIFYYSFVVLILNPRTTKLCTVIS